MFPMRRAKRINPEMAREMENIISNGYVLVSSPCPSVLCVQPMKENKECIMKIYIETQRSVIGVNKSLPQVLKAPPQTITILCDELLR